MGGLERVGGRRSKLATTLGVLALILGGFIASTTPAAASGVQVWVGYADSERADAVNFPTPWSGAPNTTFEGCVSTASTACIFDTAGVRVVNTTSSSLTVNSVVIHIDTCAFTGWAPATLSPGAELIVTQTGPIPISGCTGPSPARMDPSDIGPNSTDYAGICTPDGIKPVVDITINGTTTSYTDSFQILNTGGFDTGTCSGNESTQWTLIGQPPCPGGALLSLSPTTQTHAVGTTATVLASFTNHCGQPLSNVNVDFAIQQGPNAGRTGTAVTDVNGVATFNYSSASAGTDTVAASVTNMAGSIPAANTVTVVWIPFAPGGGAFVISDLRDHFGGSVYWWGAQWWKKDPFSNGLAPASFKGFELSNRSPWCGQTWTTRPGNSPHPPKTVPAVMAVIVSTHVTKKGPVISGDILHIVLVQTNRGYGPNPGHPGTGTIIATLC